MIRIVYSLVFILSLLSQSNAEVKKQPGRYYPVTRIVDGDTFWIDDGTRGGKKIRLIGVDAPETRNTGRKVVSEFGKVSTAYLKKLVAGKTVRLEYDIDRTDRYGRTLAYVYLKDGTFVNAALVRNGYATVMTIPPNVKYQELFLRLEKRARLQGKGLWKD